MSPAVKLALLRVISCGCNEPLWAEKDLGALGPLGALVAGGTVCHCGTSSH